MIRILGSPCLIVTGTGWPTKVFERVGLDFPIISMKSNRADVHYIFETAIAEANMEELCRLDNLFATDLIEKRGW